MDTRWKKLAKAGSLLLFLAGLYLVIMTMLSGGFYVLRELVFGEGIESIREMTESDYQNTKEFRGYVEDKLEELLSMAAGGDGWQAYGITYGGMDGAVYEDVVIQSGSGAFGDSWFWGSGFASSTVASSMPVEVAAEAIPEEEALLEMESPGFDDREESVRSLTKEERLQAHHKELAKDKNLLYQIYYEGELLYTNAEGFSLDGASAKLPEGYNFLVYFDGTETHIYKNGQELDIYGDGYYEAGSEQWYVPGYRNFMVDEATKQAKVVMAVAEHPQLYVEGQYTDYGSSRYGSYLVWMEKKQIQNHRDFIRNIGLLFLGIVMVAASLYFGKQKKPQTGNWQNGQGNVILN